MPSRTPRQNVSRPAPVVEPLHIELILTFDTGEVRRFNLSIEAYREMKTLLRTERKPGSEATLALPLADENGIVGEFLLPWARVVFAEAFLRGSLDPDAVAKQALSGGELMI